MKSVFAVASVVLFAVSIALGVMLVTTRQKLGQQSESVKQMALAITNSEAALRVQQESVGLLEQKVGQLVQVLTNSTAQLNAARATIKGYQDANDEERKSAEKLAALMAEVPKPEKTATMNSGREVITVTFPKVLSKSSMTIAVNAKFVSVSGRQLVFTTSDGSKYFDVDSLHPGVLYHLGLDAEDVKRKKLMTESAQRAQYNAAAEQMRKTRLEEWEVQSRMAAEQAKAAAEIAKQQAQARAIAESAMNERMKAEAAAKQADAAMIQALTPQQTIIQNVNHNRLIQY